jgi:hypothetical protein
VIARPRHSSLCSAAVNEVALVSGDNPPSMVPHSLFVSSDRQVDLALNLLTLIVGGGLAAAAVVLALMLLRPAAAPDRGDVGPPEWASMSAVLQIKPRLEFDLHIPYGPTIYRCEHGGRVTYSDRPCMGGRLRPFSLRPS